MKKIKTLKKIGAIMMGTLGITSLMSSCNKEKDCDCEVSTTYSYSGGPSQTYTESYTVTTQEKCFELNRSVDNSYTYYGYTVTYTNSVECTKK